MLKKRMEGHSPAPVKTLAARTSGAMLRESRRAVLCGFSACAAALFLPALAGCSDDLPAQKASMVLAAAPRDAKPAAVETVPALSSFLAAYEVAGTVAADERVEVASRIPAFIREVAVKEGDAVKKGDILVRLDDADVESAVRAAEAKAAAARAASRDAQIDAEKYARLFKDGFISDLDLRKINLKRDAAKSDAESAESLLAEAKSQRQYVLLRSPIDGRVAKRLRRSGDVAAPLFPILVIESERAPRFEIHVPESRAASIRPGERASVVISERAPVGAAVELVGTSADAVTRTFLVRFVLDAGAQASPGEFGRARFEALPTDRPAVPKRALAVRGGVTGAFVVREGRAAFTWLRLGRETLAQCSKVAAAEPVLEVLAGLRGDELLVDRPNDRLADGDPVTITSPRSAEKMQNAEAMK